MGIAYFVTSQETACRYCYGAARATMQIWGYSEKQIQDLEYEATLADGITRMVVEFACKLAKSNSTPAREDREALIAGGLNTEAAPEIAACVVEACFANRIATFLALLPNLAMERIPTNLIGRLKLPFLRKQMLPRKMAPPEFPQRRPMRADHRGGRRDASGRLTAQRDGRLHELHGDTEK
jgi:hypothetical protein